MANNLAPGLKGRSIAAEADLLGTNYASLSQAPGHHGGMAGGASTAGEDAHGLKDAVDVIGVGLGANQDYALSRPSCLGGLGGIKICVARSRTRRSGGPPRKECPLGHGVSPGLLFEPRHQEPAQLLGVHPLDGLLFGY